MNNSTDGTKPLATKERILEQAILDFGKYGYYGATTRMIAKDSNINISALHYHWGDKKDLYEAALIDVNRRIGRAQKCVGEQIQGLSRNEQIDISVGIMSDFLFANPQCSALTLSDTLLDTQQEELLSDNLKDSTLRNFRNVASILLGGQEPSQQFLLELMGIIHLVHHFVVSKSYFMKLLDIREESAYIDYVNRITKQFYVALLTKE